MRKTDFSLPLESFTVLREASDTHPGLDLVADLGEPIYAAAGGTVVSAGANEGNDELAGYGLLVIIDHGNGLQSYYAHNSENLVSAGDRVAGGQLIAKVGSTGNSTGPHLHFEARRDDVPLQLTLSQKSGGEPDCSKIVVGEPLTD